ncbi:DUF3021 domain-containing protein [Lactobacillus sp. CC-MHH1034]|nr:DUF3021 domain-containing protein [Agrilactobacillus fermenti]
MTGIGFGATVYLLMLIFNVQPNHPSIRNGLSVLLLSGLIGLISQVFISEWSVGLQLVSHFIGTLLIVLGMMGLNHWLSIIALKRFLGLFVLVYLLVWGGVYLQLRIDIHQINEKLIENHQHKSNNN